MRHRPHFRYHWSTLRENRCRRKLRPKFRFYSRRNYLLKIGGYGKFWWYCTPTRTFRRGYRWDLHKDRRTRPNKPHTFTIRFMYKDWGDTRRDRRAWFDWNLPQNPWDQLRPWSVLQPNRLRQCGDIREDLLCWRRREKGMLYFHWEGLRHQRGDWKGQKRKISAVETWQGREAKR